MTFTDFKSKAELEGLAAIEHTVYHWQLRSSGLIVNYYPTTKTVYANGTKRGAKCGPEQAIKIAVEGKNVNHLATKSKQNSRLRKLWRASRLKSDPQCHYCHSKLDERTATIDHVIPASAGGAEHPNNWVLSCVKCNSDKADTIPGAIGVVLNNNVYKPKRRERAAF